jgi:hypothetical protein
MSAWVGRLRQPRVGTCVGLSIAMVLSACVPVWSRSFRGLEPVSPSVQLGRFSEVGSLQPELRWKPAKAQGPTYDLIIWDSGLDPEKTLPREGEQLGSVVYQREGLSETSHQVDMPLKPNTLYFWSVRTREGSTVGDWSIFDGWTVMAGLVGYIRQELHGLSFGFKTPP